MLRFCYWISFILFTKIGYTQTVIIQGNVSDSLNKPLPYSNIFAEPKGSEEIAFTSTDNKGKLKLKKNETYNLTVSYLGFKSIEINSIQNTIEDFVLIPKEESLNEVILEYTPPIVVKKDTISFKTDKFVTGEERKLREVLKKLPSVEVDRDGNVTVNGKQVDKLLVECKAFFTGDTKLGVNNIPADAVDDVVAINNYNEIPFLKGQNYFKATYMIYIDTEKIEKKLKDEIELDNYRYILMMVDAANNSTLELYFDNKSTYCKVSEQLTIDDTNLTLSKGALIILNVANDIYYKSNASTYYEKRTIDNKSHLVKNVPKDYNWNITKETKNINGLIYRKAITSIKDKNINYKIEAWFCPSISVNAGPGYFNGLPGLITEVYVNSKESEFDYEYKLTKLERISNKKNLNPPISKYKILTEEQSQEKFREANAFFEN